MSSQASVDERRAFADRFSKTLLACGFTSSPTDVTREFNVRWPTQAVTVHAARKWLKGEAIPSQDKLLLLAAWLRVNAAWLRYGSAELENAPPEADIDMSALAEDLKRLPIGWRSEVHEFIHMLIRAQRRLGKP